MATRQTLQEMTDKQLIEKAEKLLHDGGGVADYLRMLREMVIRLRRLQ